ncbi:FKBP-type peptidyl-prolyl cis-trans isomerase [Niveibacterium sp. SC-1]|uniref:FKBP-type peptidyl-prolyl cis-trans isomerase n=1 Tax=Niveibacterium sp. SC-1 TaxID=3135646 RepID=UPI00311EF43B
MSTITADSLITLNYRIANAQGQALISTFEATPATLKMGSGEMLPSIERCLHGLTIGESRSFELQPEQAFGPRQDRLVKRVPREGLAGAELAVGSVIQLSFDTGDKMVGLILELDDASALIDFNHPLAGKPIRFDVEVIGIN